MKPKVEVIASLIALSASDNIEEARTAAHKACQMIREGGFKVVAKDEKPKIQTHATNPPSTSDYTYKAPRPVPSPAPAYEPPGVKYRPSRQWSDYVPSGDPFRSTFGIEDKEFQDILEAFRKAGIR